MSRPRLPRRFWTPEEVALVRELYPDFPSAKVAQRIGRTVSAVYALAHKLDLHKSQAFLASPASGRTNGRQGIGTRFEKGHVPANKGLRRPGWGPGRMKETQFKKGQLNGRAAQLYVPVGSLRMNADGYVDMKISEAPGARAWRAFHVVLWEDANGRVPKGHTVCFKDRDTLNIDLDNLELVSRAELCRRNSIHRLPPELKGAIMALGQFRRRVREEQNRRSA